ncbi:hypothetical protein [Dickeya sp. NCPPB 3274]|uniref:hypothetical protein n=1 Tax=Dickeya sp. NCPPB 3274 TaxID=568766 RepID=UPI0008FC0793|nr:hypothetical protein [Dickeya sp. NCPPB 3274]
MKDDFDYVEPGSIEWETMWKELSLFEINAGDTECEDKDTGERWQYMGTKDDVHVFRHRFHPRTKNREHIKIKRK